MTFLRPAASSGPASRIEHRSLLDASFLLQQWDSRHARHLSSLQAESQQLKEKAARLAPSGECPEESLPDQLIEIGKRYKEIEQRIMKLERDDSLIRSDVEKALRSAQTLDEMIQEVAQELQISLSEDRQKLCSEPHLVEDLRPIISRAKRQIKLLGQASDRLHQCRWSELRSPFDELELIGWETRRLTDFAIGPDHNISGLGAVGLLEAVQQRLDRLTR